MPFVISLILFFSSFASAQSGPAVSWDLGVSLGSYNEVSYTEANLGLNLLFVDWFMWRNAAFYRFISEEDAEDYYGLDSSARFIARGNWGESSGITAFAGPGFRFPSEGENVPFAEAGLVLKLGGLRLGGGAKVLLYRLTNSGENDKQFFIILSGGGSL